MIHSHAAHDENPLLRQRQKVSRNGWIVLRFVEELRCERNSFVLRHDPLVRQNDLVVDGLKERKHIKRCDVEGLECRRRTLIEHRRLVSRDDSSCAAKREELCAFDIHLEKVNAMARAVRAYSKEIIQSLEFDCELLLVLNRCVLVHAAASACVDVEVKGHFAIFIANRHLMNRRAGESFSQPLCFVRQSLTPTCLPRGQSL